jgi:Spy/CpxP family protein refolding chaperone
MKNLLIALAIVFGLCLQSAVAQTATAQPDKEKVKAEVVERVKAQLAKYDKELQLTADQKAQVKTILTDQMEKLEPVRKEYEHKTQAIKTETRGKLRGILTPEQRTKLDKMKAMDAEYGKKLEPVKEPTK